MAMASVLAASAASATKALSAAAAVTKGVLPWVLPVLFGTAAVSVGVVATRERPHVEEASPRSISASPHGRAFAPGPPPAAAPVQSVRRTADPEDAPPPSTASSAVARTLAPTVRPQAPAEQGPELSGELRVLDAANRALAAGDFAAASAALDRYARDFPHGALAEEALAIRVRVWARSGDRDRARALYERLAQTYPASPYLDGLREALGPPAARPITSPSP
jgi:TolA-binding protein